MGWRTRIRASLAIAVAVAAVAAVAAPPSVEGPDEIRARMREGRFGDAEASARRLLAQAEAEHGADSVEVATALELLVAAITAGGMTANAEAVPLAERAVRVKSAALGENHPAVAESLLTLGVVSGHAGALDASRQALERALAILDAAPEVDRTIRFRTQLALAQVEDQRGDLPASIRMLEAVIAEWEADPGADEASLATPLGMLAWAKIRQGDTARALELYDRTLALRERHQGPSHPDVALALAGKAGALAALGRFDESLALYERARRICDESLGADHPLSSQIYVWYGDRLLRVGRIDEARRLAEHALAAQEAKLGPSHPMVATTLGLLAALSNDVGDHVRARALNERALAIRESVYGTGHLLVAQSLNDLAATLYQLGDYAAALPLYERALAVREKVLGSGSFEVAGALYNLGLATRSAGELTAAAAQLSRALSICEASGVCAGLHGQILLESGWLARMQGELPAARDWMERAVRSQESVLGPEHIEVARSLARLGVVELALDHQPVARALRERALRITEARLDSEHPQRAHRLAGLAESRLVAGEADAALDLAIEAERVGRAHQRLVTAALGEREALRYGAIRPVALDHVVQGVLDGSARVPDAWDALVRSRGVVLDEMVRRRRAVAQAPDAETEALARREAEARRRLAHLVLHPSPQLDESIRARVLADARAELDSAERALAARGERGVGVEAGLDAVVRALSADTALVAFVRFERTTKPVPDAPAKSTSPWYAAFVRPAGGGRASVLPLGPAQEIEALVERWRVVAASAPGGLGNAGRRAEADYREVGERLRRKIWDPVGARIGAAALVLIVPDGALSLVALGALPADEARYLVETVPPIQYLSTERDVLHPAEPAARGGMLAVGDPDFDLAPAGPRPPGADRAGWRAGAPSCANFASRRFDALPGARREVQEIAALFPDQPARVLSGAEALEGSFKREVAGRRILHVATHGFFLQEMCPSLLGVGAALEPGQDPPRVTTVAESPLVLSGLVLAGANRRDDPGAAGTEDGLLTAEEVAALDLRGVEWAVLSACDTGLGTVHTGEGVLGLRRAFQIAGARTVILSLWRVGDEASRRFMLALYKERLAGRSTAQAMRGAARSVLDSRRRAGQSTHPVHWGAFVAAGDWR